MKTVDLVQGTLDLLILKALALEPLHGWAIARRIRQLSQGRPAASSRARSTRRCTASSTRAGSPRSGASPSRTGARSTTRSRAPATASSKRRPRPGSASPPRSRWSSGRCPDAVARRDRPDGCARSCSEPPADAEMDEEIRAHLEHQVAENLAAGMDPRAAREAALRELRRRAAGPGGVPRRPRAAPAGQRAAGPRPRLPPAATRARLHRRRHADHRPGRGSDHRDLQPRLRRRAAATALRRSRPPGGPVDDRARDGAAARPRGRGQRARLARAEHRVRGHRPRAHGRQLQPAGRRRAGAPPRRARHREPVPRPSRVAAARPHVYRRGEPGGPPARRAAGPRPLAAAVRRRSGRGRTDGLAQRRAPPGGRRDGARVPLSGARVRHLGAPHHQPGRLRHAHEPLLRLGGPAQAGRERSRPRRWTWT